MRKKLSLNRWVLRTKMNRPKIRIAPQKSSVPFLLLEMWRCRKLAEWYGTFLGKYSSMWYMARERVHAPRTTANLHSYTIFHTLFKSSRSKYRHMLICACLASVLLLSACGSSYEFKGTPFDPADDASEIVGIMGDNEEFVLTSLQDQVVVVFFGYTFCPDICPLTLAEMNNAYQALGDAADDLAVVFISIDPERDSPEQLKAYVNAFNENFYGVHISDQVLEQAKTDYSVFAEKEFPSGEEDSKNYLMAHTGWVYVIDRAGKLRVLHRHDVSSEEIGADLAHLLQS